MRRALAIAVTVFVATAMASAQGARVVPTIITNHYDKSEIESHGVVTVMEETKSIRVEVKDLASDAVYAVVVLNETDGKRSKLGTLTTDGKGYASAEYSMKDLYPDFNAMLLMNDEDVIQYAQLIDAHHGCICKHSGGSIVTRRLDQECFECPCGVKYEICCGGAGKKH